jgi:hypothetical protein
MRGESIILIGKLGCMSPDKTRSQPPAPQSSANYGHHVALEARFRCDITVEAAQNGSVRFAVTRRDLTHRFPTLDQLEAFLMRASGSDPAMSNEVNRGFEGRCAFYKAEADRFLAMGDAEVAEVLLKPFVPPTVKPNAYALARARTSVKQGSI